MYKGLDKDLEKLYQKLQHQFDIRIVSKENWFTIPPTLFFLSKCMPRIQNYNLVATNQEIWKVSDILITSDPELLTNVPRGKKVIKVLRPYNENISYKGEMNIFQIIDLIDNKEFEKIIGYKPLK
jgi:hypothetical protein